MTLPTLTKAGNAYSVFTFEKSRFLPTNQPLTPNQILGFAGGGQMQVVDLGDEEELIVYVCNRVSKTNRDNLLGFIQDATVNYSLFSFTFTDEDSAATTVNLIEMSGFDLPKVRGGLYNLRLVMRKVIT